MTDIRATSADPMAPAGSRHGRLGRLGRFGRFGRFGRTLLVLELFLAVNALGGGIYLMADADSAMPIEWLDGTPVHSWFGPGVALIVGIAVLPATVALAAVRGLPHAHLGHVGVGAALIGWICVQVAVIGYVSWMQQFMLTLGVIIATLGVANLRAAGSPAVHR